MALEAVTVAEAKREGLGKLQDTLKDHDLRVISDGEDVSYRGPYDRESVDV